MHPIEVLERYWNHTSFRPLQEEIITSVLNHEDTFALLPTGGGKSVCFQIPALIQDGICIVISPLIALMKDQVNTLKAKGIKAIALTSGMSYKDLDTQLDNCIYGNYKFLYLSPERLQQTLVKERIQQMRVNLIAVDEAHCISQWGNDFRPAYKNISSLREMHPHVTCIALTASAKHDVIDDIVENLDFINPNIFKASFARPNIAYGVMHTDDKLFHLEHLLNRHAGSSIVYVRNRRATIDIHNYLTAKNFSSTFYHGGITNKEKQERLTQWINGQKRIMVATTAFGMGIDKANVRSVIHYNLPESLESYYQEAGRAGRDGKLAHAIILKQHIDEDRLRSQFLNTLPSVTFVKTVYNKLCNYFQISYGEGENTMHQLDFKSFCTHYKLSASITYNALILLDRNAIITLTQHFNFRTKIQFTTTNAVLFKYLETHKDLNLLVKVLLRTYGGIFDYETKVNLNLVVQKSKLSEAQVIAQLQRLEKNEVISLQMANTDSEITFLKPREDDITINPIAKIIEQQHMLTHNQIESVLRYIKNDSVCRSQQLLNYFGEKSTATCGQCSVCIAKASAGTTINTETIKLQILKLLETEALSSRQLLQKIQCSEQELIQQLSELIELKQITLTHANTYIPV
ncbi:ATP-dependent DNA helicase RecQ [Winogradskyella epiphytica]|uniref:ATP-dependent DNA helicase RecQ n=1 Tax=Winogradskyella epiphytica TaxID=262005 RepID=A0A2V4YB23_9FLAO|nr:RecQ family ATP-dependent DNA helicase [Winogradskyella epiphytica]PYE80232.1 ATP-dependent DNA helicase RecQ [Winogradskyella epiphytica]GGW69917.1 ATP-dependent DNA helicase RecQ2 [Winogradskyella epiphytica]